MSAAAKRRPAVVYPETDRMGEHELQRLIAELLRPMLARYLAERGVVAHAGADTFLYYAEGDPTKRVAPDVYVLPAVPQQLAVPSYKLWQVPPPSFALEFVTSDALKDYVEAPVAYAALGCSELVLFDPEARVTSKRRKKFTVFRRLARGFLQVDATHEDRVRSRALGCWLRAVGAGAELRVRLATGARGDNLVPTDEEELARLRAENAELRRRSRTTRR